MCSQALNRKLFRLIRGKAASNFFDQLAEGHEPGSSKQTTSGDGKIVLSLECAELRVSEFRIRRIRVEGFQGLEFKGEGFGVLALKIGEEREGEGQGELVGMLSLNPEP